MRPKDTICPSDEPHFYLSQGLSTGIVHWQELAQLDFQDLIRLTQAKYMLTEECYSEF